jgi:NitT/TauT family transport system substrate-binding protein
MTRRLVTLLAVGVVMSSTLLLAGPLRVSTSVAAERLTFSLSWVPYGKYAGFIAASEKGFYSREGLVANIVRGYGGADAVRNVIVREADVASAPVEDAIVARAKGARIKVVGVWQGKTSRVVFGSKRSGIRSPKDLEGKSLAMPPDPVTRRLFAIFAEKNQVDASKVRLVGMPPSEATVTLLKGGADAIIGSYIDSPALLDRAQRQGLELTVLRFSDYGISFYEDGFVVSEDLLRRNPGLVRRFLKGTIRGLVFAAENPDEAAFIFTDHYPSLTERNVLRHWRISLESMLTTEAKERGVGFIVPEAMEATWQEVVRAYNLEPREPVESMYTNEFLPATGDVSSR